MKVIWSVGVQRIAPAHAEYGQDIAHDLAQIPNAYCDQLGVPRQQHSDHVYPLQFSALTERDRACIDRSTIPNQAKEIVVDNTETMNDILSRMPWTRDQLTRAQFDAWLVSRKEAGRVIDIETCELGRWQAYDCDPYGARPDLPDEMKQIGTNRFVRSPTSNGWINEGDLPVEKIRAMHERAGSGNLHRTLSGASA